MPNAAARGVDDASRQTRKRASARADAIPIAEEEATVTRQEEELASREETLQGETHTLVQRARRLAERGATERQRGEELIERAKALDLGVEALPLEGEIPLLDDTYATRERRALLTARKAAVRAREKALAAGEAVRANAARAIADAEAAFREYATGVETLAARIAQREEEIRQARLRKEAEERERARAEHEARMRREAEERERELALERERARVEHEARMRADAERRAAKRTSIELEVTVGSEHNFFMGLSSDISEGGLFIATASPLPIGSDLNLAFSLPDGHKIVTRALVKWVRDPAAVSFGSPSGMGVQFQELRPEEKAAVTRFISTREPFFYDD